MIVEEIISVLLVVSVTDAQRQRQRNSGGGLGKIVVELGKRRVRLGLACALAEKIEGVERQGWPEVVEAQVSIAEILEILAIEVDSADHPAQRAIALGGETNLLRELLCVEHPRATYGDG